MAKCSLCGKKSKRYCIELKDNICSLCCGTKRGNEIDCSLECSIYKNAILKKNKKAVLEKANDLYDNKYQDIFYATDIAIIAGLFEQYIFETFYNNLSVNDNDLLEAYIKIYYLLNGEKELYELKEYEQEIYDYYLELFRKEKSFDEYKNKLILRLCRSVTHITGGAFGNRNYLELLRGQTTKTGIWGNRFSDIE
ncbi:MAG: hypothetical protein U9N10_02825 [Bacillota bacterium]|nr:hypothetical protein [Bacillota bacterium]